MNENVLPKYEVIVESEQKVILKDGLSAAFRICGKYTHGGRVKGEANVTITSTHRPNYWGEFENFKRLR